jgi:predicted ATPase
MRAYQHACVAVISRFAGYVGQYLGDGLLVYFGYPAAHEDDAARATRAGLGIVAAIQSLSLPPHLHLPHPLQVRVGIHTGLVVVGEIGSGESRAAHAIMGETPNIAARLQDKALPNSVVISPTTYRLVTGLFECQALGPQPLKGIATPMPVYRVIQESEAQSRFEAAVQTGLTPLVGRTHEMGLLRERWERAQRGEGQVVLLSGEPGIGKSRLVQELKDQLAREGVTRIEFRCSPYHQNSALYPIIEHLQRLLQFTRDDAPSVKLEKLQHTLSHYRFPQADTVPLLAALLSLPPPEGSPPLSGSPQKQKEQTHAALGAWLSEEAKRGAVYCVVEDLHWADPSTLEFLDVWLAQAPTTRVLMLLTFRPEFQPPWGGRSYLSPLTLSRLGRTHVEAMVERVTGGKALPSEVVQQIVAKTDGVPLFVEELTKTVVESGLLREEAGRYVGTRGGAPVLPLAIPSTLQDSLMARLDRLATVREIAQLGATIGREFSYELLHAVSPLDEATLQRELRRLVEAELVYQRGLPPQAHYFFKHALIQDTAYQSLLKSTRQQLHRELAHVLAEQFPEATEHQPELLAHHYTEAGLIEQAIPYWQRAGQRAIECSAHLEAINHLTKGLELLKTLPNTPERAQQELLLQIALGAPLMAAKGHAAPEVGQVYTRARELCRQVGETPQLFPVLWGLWAFYLLRAEHQTACELGEQLFRLAQSAQDAALLVEACHALGHSRYALGEFAAARALFEQGATLYDPQQHRSLAFHYGQDSGVICLGLGAFTLWMLGYPEQALKRMDEGLTLARELSHPFSLATALWGAALLHRLRREEQITQERAEAAIALSTAQGFPLYFAGGTILRGLALTKQGQGGEGMAQLREGLAAWQAAGVELWQPYFLAQLGEAYEEAGQPEEGLRVLAEALMVIGKTRERSDEAELYRLNGALTLRQAGVQGLADGCHQEAEECFGRAIEIARQQQAKSWELRATVSLARLWQQQGKKTEAYQLLSEVYGWFTEGFDTKDLQEAKVLLTELEGSP